MTIALVLSGGGSRGAFEVGAVNFLYDHFHVRPDVICGTSVGAINAAKLAEGGNPDEKRTALSQLTSLWLGMSQNADMWSTADWLTELGDTPVGDDFLGPLVVASLTGQPSLTVVGETSWFPDWSNPLLYLSSFVIGKAALLELKIHELALSVQALKAKADEGEMRSFLTLRPIEAKMRSRTGGAAGSPLLYDRKVAGSGVRLRLAVVSLESGALRYVTERGELLERDGSPVLPPRERMVRDAACEPLAIKVENLQEQLSILEGIPGPSLANLEKKNKLQAQLTKAQTDLATCDTLHPPQVAFDPGTVELISAVIASATMPAIFEPRKLGDEYYVDGGVREIAPVQVAFDIGGSALERIYTVVASTFAVPLTPSFEKAHFFTTLLRSLVGISLNEIVLDDVGKARVWPKPVDVIAPTFNIYEPTVIDPGLIRILMDYGFMRASDVAQGPTGGTTVVTDAADGLVSHTAGEFPRLPSIGRLGELPVEQANRLSDAVTILRLAAWDAECEYFGKPHLVLDTPLLPFRPVGPAAAIEWIRLLKWLTKAVIDCRNRHGFPPPAITGARWIDWEAHPWNPPGAAWAFSPVSVTDPACKSFVQQVEDLEQKIANIEDRAGHRTPQEIAEIALLKKKLSTARMDLATCEQGHPPKIVSEPELSDPMVLPQGALIRDPDSGAIYMLWNGSRIWLRTMAEVDGAGGSDKVRDVPPGVCDCLPLEERPA